MPKNVVGGLPARRLFVAGSTGAVGRTVLAQADAAKVPVVPHARPRRGGARPSDPRAVVFDLGDAERLTSALARCTTVLQLIGTMRSRSSGGDTYETSDVGTTRQLVTAARAAGVDHFVLLSSAGASPWMGPYLAAKARAEAVVRESGLPFTIVRPGFFAGEGHRPPVLAEAAASALGVWTWRPIAVEHVARAILRIAKDRGPLGRVVEGRELRHLGGA